MTISVACGCGQSYRVHADKVGKRFKCSDCGTLLQVPNAKDGASDDEGDGDDDADTVPAASYVPAHRRAWETDRSKKKLAREKKRAATIKRWLVILGSPLVVMGGILFANTRFPQAMLKVWDVVPFFLQYLTLILLLIVFALGKWFSYKRIREEIESNGGNVTSISWQPLQGLPFTKMWGLGIHPIGGAFYRVTYIDRDGKTRQSWVGFTARGMRWDGDI